MMKKWYAINIILDANAKIIECLKPISSWPYFTIPTNIPVNIEVNVSINTDINTILFKSIWVSVNPEVKLRNDMETAIIKGSIKTREIEMNIT